MIVNKVIVKPSRSYLGVGGEGVEEKKNTKNKGILHCKVLRQKELHIFRAKILLRVLSSRWERKERERKEKPDTCLAAESNSF